MRISIERAALFAVSLLLVGGAMTSCSGSDSKDATAFESYSFTAKADGADNDSVADKIVDFNGVWECSGRGVMPVRLGGHDITALRDTLQTLACVDLTDGKARLKYPAELREHKEGKDSVAPKSKMVTDLSVALLTPQTVVFRVFGYTYPEGAAHGMYSNRFVNYDLREGKILSVSDIFNPGYEKELRELIADKVESTVSSLLVEKDEIPVSDNFRLTDSGIEFVYSLYSVAPYSDGEVTADFAVYELDNLLKPSAKVLILGE